MMILLFGKKHDAMGRHGNDDWLSDCRSKPKAIQKMTMKRTPFGSKLAADENTIVHHSSGKKGCKCSLGTGEEYGRQAAGHDWTAAGAGNRGEYKFT